jgi:hypothetical protein
MTLREERCDGTFGRTPRCSISSYRLKTEAEADCPLDAW